MRKLFLAAILAAAAAVCAQAQGQGNQVIPAGGSGSGIPYGTGGGTAQAQTVTTTPNITSLTTGTFVTWLPVAANTAAAPTLAAGTTAATAITKCGTVALVPGDLLSTVWAVAQYDGTEWVLQNPVQFGCSEGGLPTTGGTANAPTLTVAPAITAYSAGMVFNFTNGAANTGATTIAISGLAAKNVTKCGTTALVANDLTVAATAVILYDGTEFQLLNPQATGCGTTSASAIAFKTYESFYQNGTANQPAQNTTLVWGVYLNQPITTSTITYLVNTADNTANLYDIGVYNASGTLLAHTGATAGTTFAPSASNISLTWTGGAVTIPAGKIYIAYTTNCSATCMKFFAGQAYSFLNAVSPTGGTTSGGALNSSITAPADVFGNTSPPSAIIR